MLGSIGYRWSLRVLGLLVAAIGGSASLVYKPRVSVPKSGNARLLYMLCKDPRFLCVCSAVTLIRMGYFEPVLYVPTAAAKETGMKSTASNIVLVFNAGTTIGRILSGPISAVLGPHNTNLLANILASLVIFVFLLVVKTAAGYYAFSVIFSILSSLYLAINTHIAANEFGTHAIASSVGLTIAFSGIGVLIGIPVQGALYEKYDRPNDRITAVSVWAGICYASVSMCYAILRSLVARKQSGSYFSKM
ncbi:MFS general substrate transporter [Linderina pennispora]|uniref:MFS general substrate transporter n=1 Tax=Linderina pennispora TaxID=61395 RepID=A0A1Y1W9M3_9FUNG|nr:MFS general substrate transporter [Linderina pennispora]ORX70085.1 MFS general substrate transporter [Linderina pennispora]